jgi:N-acylglucosamine-6-phosphate 2-epimerase
MDVLERIHKGIIVSCQALEDEPLHGPMLMAAMARSAALGGAVGIRTNGAQEVEVCKRITSLPIIGIKKVEDTLGQICITPTFAHAEALVRAGADIVAVDARQDRPHGEPLIELFPRIRTELGAKVMADCATFADAQAACEIGVDLISTTFGFKENALGIEPDYQLLEDVSRLGTPVIAEGGFWYPEQVVQAMQLGVWAVVIGSAITRPMEITRRFVRAIEQCQG